MRWTFKGVFWSLAVFLACSGLADCVSVKQRDEGLDYEIVFPQKIVGRAKRSADGLLDKDEHLMYKIKGFGRDLLLDLHKNTLSVHGHVSVISYNDNGKEIFNEVPVQDCHYQGQIEGDSESTVILDTCDGLLRGVIEDEREELFIEPIISKGANAHKLSRAKIEEEFDCGVESTHIENSKNRSRRSLAIDPLFRPYMNMPIIDKTRYTEVILVADNKIFTMYGSNRKDVTKRVVTLVNAVDKIYQKINIRIILKKLEIWSQTDLVPQNISDAGLDLATFQEYRRNNQNKYMADTVHLLRGKIWDKHGGMAYKDMMCKLSSTGVVYWNNWSPLGPWMGFAHEMGHNFGFDHDQDRPKLCKCLTPRGCIMNTFKTRVPGFSTCNLKDLGRIDDSCLYNIPTQDLDPKCGNGIKDANEDCDCGTKENCAVVDPCCNPSTCKLYSSSNCSNLDSCCHDCQPVPAGKICRKGVDACDVPEYCDGQSSKCPANDMLPHGTSCVFNKLILPGNVQSTSKMTLLPATIKARYVRINPVSWETNICMKAEVYGCKNKSPSQRDKNHIRSRNNFCVEAKDIIGCNKDDESKLYFVKSDCDDKKSSFLLMNNGTLIHECTGNPVCLVNPSLTYGSDLIVKKNCQASIFARDGKLLCLKSTLNSNPKVCIHPKGGSIFDGVELTTWETKTSKEHLHFLFSREDCLEPLGMSNNKIKDNQIKASSNKIGSEAKAARLGGFGAWCSSTNDIDQYLQIDLGQSVNIGGISTEGTFNGHGVKEFKLLYSNDGTSWTELTKAQNNAKKSSCCSGMCLSPTAQQCSNAYSFQSSSCPQHNGLVCGGNGECTSNHKCHCKDGYDPATNCVSRVVAVDGQWGDWLSWSKCDRVCDGGFSYRHRFCDKPAPAHGGTPCQGKRFQKIGCNTPKCPVVNSCQHLKTIGIQTETTYPSGIYTINPGGGGAVKTYCDMTRNGGGWTLLVTSHTNTWTPSTIKQRNEMTPSLDSDYSILFKADEIRNKGWGNTFEYRIEAQEFGRWGGIWKAPNTYSFVSSNNQQTNVELVEKFDQWIYEDYGIEKRMPWVEGPMLTTSIKTDDKLAFGTIAANITRFYPAPWINNKEQEQHPTNIWYWMRESVSKVATSCLELQLMRIESNKPLQNGIHSLTLDGDEMKTFCDFTTHGGGWTLVFTSSSRFGWNRQHLARRNMSQPSLNKDFSILTKSDSILKRKLFQYKIEDGTSQWGGIFEADAGQRLLAAKPQTNIRLLKKLSSNWDENTSSLDDSIPYTRDNSLVYTTSQSGSSGTLVTSSQGQGTYIDGLNENPQVIRIWVREGTWRSCNEIVMKSGISKDHLQDGLYMIKTTPVPDYLPVICDMKSDAGAWTLLVTSATGGWKDNEVRERNKLKPSLSTDYSILGLGDSIKSLGHGDTFKYKLEAHKKGQWGGIWTAPRSYSFVATSNTQTDVTLVQQFSQQWTYNQWSSSIEKRMPWIDNKNKSLLTTSTHSGYYEYGSIITYYTKNNPAPWISPGMINPGKIWYWVNENDCDANRTVVHGGLSEWSTWSVCSHTCVKHGKQTRKRTCSNPKPRCGGNECDAALLAQEKRSCVYCPKSAIRGGNGNCIEPAIRQCSSVTDGTVLQYVSGPCDKFYMEFILGADNVLIHRCSGKKVCSNGGWGSELTISSTCAVDKSKFIQTTENSLQHVASGSGICVHPNGGQPNSGTKLITWSGCTSPQNQPDKLKLHLFNRNLQVIIASGVRSQGGLCLKPQSGGCHPSDNTPIVYNGTGGSNVKCDQDDMKFIFSNGGSLKHLCSDMYVCPDPSAYSSNVYEGLPIILKQVPCNPHSVYYTRTSSKSLEYRRRSGYCVKKSTSGDEAVLMNDCTSQDAILDFYELV